MQNIIQTLHNKEFLQSQEWGQKSREHTQEREAGQNNTESQKEVAQNQSQNHPQNELQKEKIIINIPACITNNPNAYGIKRCKDLGIACEILSHKEFATKEAFESALVACIQKYHPDLTILAGFMRILSPIFTDTIPSINIHPSLLPKHKGANAIKDTYLSDDKEAGVSVHWVNEILDGGEIITQRAIPKIAGESLQDFENRIHQLEYTLYPQAILEALNLSSAV
ncbi:phosphoribosylglycinamide formyltransferase [Helicobacter sp. 11S02596-1]|uniref:phosphoribosylglycinamide formyltransferase n=1 Tax=Helicobacter sp. 11S02596-1 TaxID=1476194 RepID=UPI000BA7A9B0|nr:phosphoribosylglycinamide formyltransferase [Helicobacter sp. 11S02596-1]